MHATRVPAAVRGAARPHPLPGLRRLHTLRRGPIAAAGGQVEQRYGWSLEGKLDADGELQLACVGHSCTYNPAYAVYTLSDMVHVVILSGVVSCNIAHPTVASGTPCISLVAQV
jgi:hypothetical protein